MIQMGLVSTTVRVGVLESEMNMAGRCPQIRCLPCYELSSSYLPGSVSKSPLKLDVEVIKNGQPTTDQIYMILDNLLPICNIDDLHLFFFFFLYRFIHLATIAMSVTGTLLQATTRIK
jgi:hypothetical protein